MTPVAKTGLHCGGIGLVVGSLIAAVTPVAKTGLHCGDAKTHKGGCAVTLVTPVAKTGLHCGDEAMFLDDATLG